MLKGLKKRGEDSRGMQDDLGTKLGRRESKHQQSQKEKQQLRKVKEYLGGHRGLRPFKGNEHLPLNWDVQLHNSRSREVKGQKR